MVAMNRVYGPATSDDGYRVLVERLWPRGVRKEAAHLDAWEKGIAPSDELRRWYGHDPEKWEEFQKRYQEERSEEHTSELQSLAYLVCRLLLEKKKKPRAGARLHRRTLHHDVPLVQFRPDGEVPELWHSLRDAAYI